MRTGVKSFQTQSFLLAVVAATTAGALPLYRWRSAVQPSDVRVVRHAHNFVSYAIRLLFEWIV